MLLQGIAYTSDRGGSFDIWLYRLADSINWRLTQGLGDAASVPYWSPDGRKLAFIGKQNRVYTLDLDTGATAGIDQIEPYTLLDWSPNSQLLSYVKKGLIVVYDTVFHTSRTITQPGASDVQWFPSGNELLFTAPDAAGVSQLYSIHLDGTGKKQLTNNAEGPLHHVRLSPDGTFALYTTPGASISIVTAVALSTGQTFALEGGPLAKNYFPEWAPNGLEIAYSATAYDNRHYYSYIQTDGRTGGSQATWAVSDCYSTPVSWSPHGRQIAFLTGCGNEQSASQLWVVDRRNPVPVKLVEGGRITALQWSPSMKHALPFNRYTNAQYRVSFLYPSNWRKITEERYEGADGFFQIAAISSASPIEEVCRTEAQHPLRPYGSAPRIVKAAVHNQAACLLYPSADQPAEMKRQSALIAKYPQPIQIGDASYNYFILWADFDHLNRLAGGLTFR